MFLNKVLVLFILMSCLTGSVLNAQQVSVWLSNQEQTEVLNLQKEKLIFLSNIPSNDGGIKVESEKKYQLIDGFGFALTGGSAQHLMNMSPDERSKLLIELFGSSPSSITVSYLRLSIGSSDLNDRTFSYDDLAPGTIDPQLLKFNLSQDTLDVIPVLKQILAINPKIKILASPWSAPIWMKTNNNIQGGRLKEEYYQTYANYFVKYLKSMKANGITIDAITIQNEPFNDGNTPSMQMFAKEQAAFIKNNLGPSFKKSGISTKIILYDHNCDAPEYPISILSDPEAAKYINGSGFHLYTGSTSALTKVHNSFPQKDVYFTEMMAVSRNAYNLAGPVNRILIGATRNWSKNVILWNLASNSKYEPHTDNGGCSMCQGAVTIDKNLVTRNTAYYVIAHASKFVDPGSLRIESTQNEHLGSVAFQTTAGKIVLIVSNNDKASQNFAIGFKGKNLKTTLSAGAVATYVW